MRGLTELLKGSLEGMILERISRGETYGYEITKYLNDLGFDEIVEGTVYTILLRIEKKGLVEVEKKKSDLGPARKFYTLSESGKEELALFWKRWEFIQAKMIQVKGGQV
ncbi:MULTISPECIES: PadR family transcriptional regulator [Listeria]|uniref:PadR family transcriptional regulator n=4 Tax=Listeria TaxID=1637 RepID=A0ABR5E5B6_LISSE|nr:MULTISPECIES: PadR family transcriptional regulator [Listeria]EFR97787.1 PadR family transcriptional regulator [Listeria ivanovii FSL F6-596]MBC6179146.1 PadR family transcriptional regulator [Listeria welshimeri]AIS59136.1 PadR family transcriptional regulator [Listeria ivanovii subsp. londoniensis]AIS61981.1 PadR family transcriptional regulator [Listeria ivanovii subsp. londoniensis]EFS00952.1 PadR family transcriptional regulator [Listeria seeligeri FSL N1-067]